MKILQVGKFYPIKGGVEKVMYDLMTGLAARGVACDMLCAAIEGGTRTVELEHGARLFCCHTLKKVSATMISPAMVAMLRKICHNYDIIHIHHPDPTACLALWCSRYKGRVVLHWHSDIVRQKRLLKMYLPMQEWLIRRADIIVGTSPVYVAKSPFLRHMQHKTTHLPIGIEAVKPDAAGAERLRQRFGGRRIIFSLGRLVPYKGFRYLVEAARYLPDDCVVVIGGSGPLREDLERQIHDLGLQDKVLLIGRVPDEDLPAYYTACTLFCLPSVQKTEAFGIVQIEAMSCGKPVVTTTIPESGVAWVNGHGVSGLNVPPENAKALAEAICEVTKDEEVYSRYCEGARKRFRELFTIDRMIDKCLALYAGL